MPVRLWAFSTFLVAWRCRGCRGTEAIGCCTSTARRSLGIRNCRCIPDIRCKTRPEAGSIRKPWRSYLNLPETDNWSRHLGISWFEELGTKVRHSLPNVAHIEHVRRVKKIQAWYLHYIYIYILYFICARYGGKQTTWSKLMLRRDPQVGDTSAGEPNDLHSVHLQWESSSRSWAIGQSISA